MTPKVLVLLHQQMAVKMFSYTRQV